MELAILALINVGLTVASSYLQPKPKLERVERGKQDDLRFTIVEEGAFIPRVYGQRARLGGNLFWSTPTFERATHTPGNRGGKKGRGATPPTTTFSYDKSFAAYVCEGPIRAFLRIKEGDEVLFNQFPTGGAGYYEAEDAFNTLAGGALIVSDLSLLSGRKVTLPPGASVQFNHIHANLDRSIDLGIYYQANAAIPITVRVNATDQSATLPDSDDALAVLDVPALLQAGTNVIKITNGHGSQSVSIDRIFAFPFFEIPEHVTGIVNELDPVVPDLNNPGPLYNHALRVDPNGVATGTIAAAGQAQIDFYLGTHTQPQSPTIVAAEGAANAEANRGLAHAVFTDYFLRNNGQLENLTFDVQPLTDDLAQACAAEYKLRGATDANLDLAALAGTTLQGLYIDRLAPLTETMTALQLFYGFDVVPEGGKIRAVPRGGASIRNIPYHELLAHEEGSERPAGVRIQHIDQRDLPEGIYIAYIDPNDPKDFTTASLFVPRGHGFSVEAETINLPLVFADPAEIIAFGKRYLFTQQLEKNPPEFSLDPKHADLIPTDVVTLELPQKTVEVRLTSTQGALPGLIKAKAAPEKAALYNQVGIGEIGTGFEERPVAFPANSFLYLADLPPLRDSDTGLFYYAGICPRGRGSFQGGYLYEEIIPDSDDYDRLAAFPHACTLGILADDLPAVTNLEDLDETNEIVIDLFFDEGLFISRPEADIRARDVNMLAIGSGPFANVVKFTTATYETASFPYARRVRLSGLLHGLKGTTNGANAGSNDGSVVALITDELRAIPDQFEKLGLTRRFTGVTVGQAVVDAPKQNFVNNGHSVRPLAPIDARINFDASDDLLVQFTDPDPDEGPANYAVEIWTSPDRSNPANRKRTIPVTTGSSHAVLLHSTEGSEGLQMDDQGNHVTLLSAHANKNNLRSALETEDVKAISLEALDRTFTRFDFSIEWETGDPFPEGDSAGALAKVGLQPLANADDVGEIDFSLCPIWVEWSNGTNAGTVKQTFKSFSSTLAVQDNLNPNPPGPRNTFLIAGTEYRAYSGYVPNGGIKPQAILSAPSAGFPFPLRLVMHVTGLGNAMWIRNIMAAGNLLPSTIYAKRDQEKDFGTAQDVFFLRIYKLSPHPQVGHGFPLDIVAFPPALLTEADTELLTESDEPILT